MSEIRNLKPECIWRNFDELTKVPRPSGHLEKVQKFLLEFAKRVGVEAFQDAAGNIVMRKPASAGMENRKTAILQAHMDMVPQKDLKSTHNFETDPIETWIDGEWVRAKGTTLGADNGMGVAAIMAIMEDNTLKHGPLEALITADEETGMFGVTGLPEGELEGTILLNLDTEDEGELIIGSAGGVDITATLDYKEVETDKTDIAVAVTVKGLKGGHSGLEIGLGRGNANKMLVRIVREAITDDEASLATWHGGNMRNAIPFEATAVLTMPKENKEDFMALCADFKEDFIAEYKGIEDGIDVVVEDVELPATQMPQEIQDNIVDAIYAVHNGVWRYIPSIPGIVETSSNFAIINIEGGSVAFKFLARSSSDSVKAEIGASIESCLNMAGMKVVFSGEYGGWDPNPDSELIKEMCGIYRKLFNKEPTVQVVHAGLECSMILNKYPGLDICSFGPTLRSPHTQNERCLIPTVPMFWDLLVKTLEEIPVK